MVGDGEDELDNEYLLCRLCEIKSVPNQKIIHIFFKPKSHLIRPLISHWIWVLVVRSIHFNITADIMFRCLRSIPQFPGVGVPVVSRRQGQCAEYGVTMQLYLHSHSTGLYFITILLQGYNKLLSSNHNMATVVCAGRSRSPDLSSGILRTLSGHTISIPGSTSSRRPL